MDLPINLPGDVLQDIVSARFPGKAPDVIPQRCMQSPQQFFERGSVAALNQQDQKNVVLLRRHREVLIPYL
jgi:hypothetical protein